MNIPLAAGRMFTDQDLGGKAKVAIVNAYLARKYFGEPKNALGHWMARGSGSDAKFDIEIVGVIGDTKHSDMRKDVLPTVYRPFFQDEDHPSSRLYAVLRAHLAGARGGRDDHPPRYTAG